MNNVSDDINVDRLLFSDWAIVSTSFVTLDSMSPDKLLSKYFNGNLFIFFDILVLNFLAYLLATFIIDSPSI